MYLKKREAMKEVAIMTDDIATIAPEMAQKFGIRIIPYHVVIDGKDYLDTEIDMGRLYARLRRKENLPTTAPPNTREILDAYHELSQRAKAIIHISMTSVFTAQCQAATQAKEIASEELPSTTIEIIDSQTVGPGQLLITLEAAKAITQGKNIKEIIKLVNQMILKINLLDIRDTLFYLDKGGRIFEAKPWAEAEQASSFRTITEIDASTGGKTKPMARAKTKNQVMRKMVDIARERVGNKRLHAAISHANVPEQAEQLRKMVLSHFQCDELYVNEVPATIAVHNGEGLIEFGFYGSD